MVNDILGAAHEALSLSVFETTVLGQLERQIGMDAAFLACTCRPAPPTTMGLEPRLLPADRGRVYERELAPVKRVALANHGVAVDTDVLGMSHVRTTRYHREVASRVGGRHSLMGYLRLRGSETGALMLGRCRSGFQAHEIRLVESILPIIALVGASYRAASGASEFLPLTPREREVLDYVCLGYTNREIACAVGSSPLTVRNQLVSVFGKLGASTRSEAVAIARA